MLPVCREVLHCVTLAVHAVAAGAFPSDSRVPPKCLSCSLEPGALHTDEDEGEGRRGHDGAQVEEHTQLHLVGNELLACHAWLCNVRLDNPVVCWMPSAIAFCSCRAGDALDWVAAWAVLAVLAVAAGRLARSYMHVEPYANLIAANCVPPFCHVGLQRWPWRTIWRS